MYVLGRDPYESMNESRTLKPNLGGRLDALHYSRITHDVSRALGMVELAAEVSLDLLSYLASICVCVCLFFTSGGHAGHLYRCVGRI